MSLVRVARKLESRRAVDLRLALPFELRSRSRIRAELAGGEVLGVMLERGQMLRGGEQLLADDGRVIEIVAADETVSTVRCADAALLARAAYHLGNRHVALQIGTGWLRYLHDHVLDHMVEGLGLVVSVEQAPFEPEAGAYAASGHGNGHDHDHSHLGHHHG